jgi:isochorismate synthase
VEQRHERAPAEAARILGSYEAGSSFLFAAPRRTLLAKGALSSANSGPGGADSPAPPAEIAAGLLREAEGSGGAAPVVVGAVPFEETAPARLVLPATVRRAGPLDPTAVEDSQRPVVSGCEIRAVPEPAEFVRGVEHALARIEREDLQKVVLSRSLRVVSREEIDPRQLLYSLVRQSSGGYTFAVDLSGGNVLIGASPELLVSKRAARVVSNPLAGSAARDREPGEDRRRAAALLASAKDRHEHALVVEAVAEELRPYCRRLDVPAEPSLARTATMWHLSSRISGELHDSGTSSLELAAALHPTPAVCGSPTELARRAIREIEPYDRGFYTGMVGWCDANGDGEWVVAIRCAEAGARSLRLFAGGGIVSASRAEDELAETTAKLRTMLLAAGLD